MIKFMGSSSNMASGVDDEIDVSSRVRLEIEVHFGMRPGLRVMNLLLAHCFYFVVRLLGVFITPFIMVDWLWVDWWVMRIRFRVPRVVVW